MSKITFRADDDLVAELEAFDASKSEVMREALRTYLDEHRNVGGRRPSAASAEPQPSTSDQSLDHFIRDRIDAILDQRLQHQSPARARSEPQDVNVTVSLEGAEGARRTDESARTPTDEDARLHGHENGNTPADHSCGQCGENLDENHVYCPNCGEKASRRLFCDCGDEIRSDWAFCPSCGRRTPAADVLESDRL